jgi:hypothetical protein
MKLGERREIEEIFQEALRAPEGGTDEGTRKSTLYQGLPFSCPFDVTRGGKPIQASARLESWKSLEN